MNGFPLTDMPYVALKRVVKKLDHPTWIDFQATCRMAEEVSMTTDKRYFLDVGDDLLAIGIFPIRNPVQLQQRHLNQQRVSVDVVVEEEERIQEEQLHNVLSVIRNRNFKDVHIRSHSEAKYHDAFTQTCALTAKLLKEYRIRGRTIIWDISNRAEELSHFTRSLDTVKIVCKKMKDFDFLANLPPIVAVVTEDSGFDRILYNKSKVVKLRMMKAHNLHGRFQALLRMLKCFEQWQETHVNEGRAQEPFGLYTNRILLNFDMNFFYFEPFLNLLCGTIQKHLVVSYDIDSSVPLKRPNTACKITLFFGYTESLPPSSVTGNPVPIFISFFFDEYTSVDHQFQRIFIDGGARMVMVCDESQIDFAPKLPHFPNLPNPHPEFIKMKNEICSRYLTPPPPPMD